MRQRYYDLTIGNLSRKLPLVKIGGKLTIASFIMLGDSELTHYCAKELIKKFLEEDFDYLVVPEAKAIPLARRNF